MLSHFQDQSYIFRVEVQSFVVTIHDHVIIYTHKMHYKPKIALTMKIQIKTQEIPIKLLSYCTGHYNSVKVIQ